MLETEEFIFLLMIEHWNCGKERCKIHIASFNLKYL